MAGFNIRLAVEREKSFCESYKYNNPECKVLNEDITELSLEEIFSKPWQTDRLLRK